MAILSIAGRAMLCALFLMSAVTKDIPAFNTVTEEMAKQGMPMPNVLLIGAIVFTIAGSLLVIVGYHARIGAAMLAVFLTMASYYFHDFWTAGGGADKANEMAHFMKNLGLIGAMIFIIANGPGAGSIDGAFGTPLEPAAETPAR